MTLTTHEEALCRKLEPGVSTTGERFETLKKMQDAGIPTVVWLSPILPFINDTKANISSILDMCAEAKVRGIVCFGMGVTLREGNREYFYRHLDRHFPGLKERYQKTYGNQYILDSPDNAHLMKLFHETCERQGILHKTKHVFAYLNAFEEKTGQMELDLESLQGKRRVDS